MSNTTSAMLPLEAGIYDEDTAERREWGSAEVARRIACKQPVFPARSLGMEYAVFVDSLPRGYPVAAVALANLVVGEGFPLCGRRYTLVRRGKSLRFAVASSAGDSVFQISPDSPRWGQFVRDVDGLLVGHAHGCDAGDLPAAWLRDPVAQWR